MENKCELDDPERREKKYNIQGQTSPVRSSVWDEKLERMISKGKSHHLTVHLNLVTFDHEMVPQVSLNVFKVIWRLTI